MFTSASCTRRIGKRTWFSFRNSWISIATIRANIFKIELNALVNLVKKTPEAEMQRRVTSRGDIDKWSKLAETSKHWQVFWWPRIRSRDSASFILVTAMPCIILQISGVVSDMLYTTWGFPIWNKYHNIMGSWAWLSDLCQHDTHTEWQARSFALA